MSNIHQNSPSVNPFASTSCAWCHYENSLRDRFCTECGHRAHMARLACDCRQCNLHPAGEPYRPSFDLEPARLALSTNALKTLVLVDVAEQFLGFQPTLDWLANGMYAVGLKDRTYTRVRGAALECLYAGYLTETRTIPPRWSVRRPGGDSDAD